MSDADYDSTMHSSPEVAAADDLMFPNEGPSTPRNAASFALDPTSELSPPNSQGRFANDSLSVHAGGAPSIINANGKRAHPSSAVAEPPQAGDAPEKKPGPVQTDPQTGYQWSNPEDAPGYEWKCNRARDEAARALEVMVDRGSMIKTRYGDPLKPEVPMKLNR